LAINKYFPILDKVSNFSFQTIYVYRLWQLTDERNLTSHSFSLVDHNIMSKKVASTTPDGSPKRALQENTEDEVDLLQVRASTSCGLTHSPPHRNMHDGDSLSGGGTPPSSPPLKRMKHLSSTELLDSTRDVSRGTRL